MYESPKLERYGSFRELTLGGGPIGLDGFTPGDPGDGCTINPVPTPGVPGICLGS